MENISEDCAMTNHKPTCPYCGAKMIPQRESTGMRFGVDYAQCVRCRARGPEIHTIDGAWDGKQDAALAVAMQRYVEPEEIAALRAELDALKIELQDAQRYIALFYGAALEGETP